MDFVRNMTMVTLLMVLIGVVSFLVAGDETEQNRLIRAMYVEGK